MAYVADRTRVVIARLRYGWRVVIDSQATIESDAENSHRICHRQVDIRDGYWRQRWHRSQLCGCAHEECFGLVWIQLESILHVPLLDVSGTSGENGQAAAVLSTRIARWSWVSSAYWWHLTPWDAMTSATGLQYTANSSGPSTDPWGTPTSRVFSEDRCCPSFTNCVRPVDGDHWSWKVVERHGKWEQCHAFFNYGIFKLHGKIK